jgi:hypothetical protein
MTSTWKFSRVGLTNVIPLPEGGGPYTIGMDKASAVYTAQLFWSPNLDASFKDDNWEVLTDINTTDVVDLALPSVARALMGRITVRPTPVLDAGIYAPVAKCEISVATANPKGVQNKQRHASGYGDFNVGGVEPVQDEYAALVLADMGAISGSFFSFQDEIDSPLTDSGPDGVTDLTNAAPPGLKAGPWPGSVSRGDDTGWPDKYTGASGALGSPVSTEKTLEFWYRRVIFGDVGEMFQSSGALNIEVLANSDHVRAEIDADPTEPDPGTWIALTAYVQGDRRRPISNNNKIYEVEVAGTTGASENFPADGDTSVDGDVTWRGLGARFDFHTVGDGHLGARNLTLPDDSARTTSNWHHVVLVKSAIGTHYYFDGAFVDEYLIETADTGPGSFGTPFHMQYDTALWTANTINIGALTGGSQAFHGDMTYIAMYDSALSAVQVAAHYAKGVELGLNS